MSPQQSRVAAAWLEKQASVTEIRVLSRGREIGRMTPEKFRKFMGVRSGFVQDLIKRFNESKARSGEPERVEQVLGR